MVSCGPMNAEKIQSKVISDFAFVPQKHFVVGATIRDNILLGRDLDENLLRKVVENADLSEDIEIFPMGLETEVGERGLTLSGGQQARLSFAR